MKLFRISFIVLLAMGMTLAFTLSAHALEIHNAPASGPAAQPHMIYFATSGLAPGIPITITGNRVNNGGNTNPFTVYFTSPGPSGSTPTLPGSDVVYFNGFQNQYILGTTVYTLVDIFPTSPFTAGLSGETTTVVANYTSCAKLVITGQPVSTTVMAGASATFSVTLADDSSASYQWYKGGSAISGANDSQYTVDPAAVSDSGSYYVVITSPCETLQSDPADLTVTQSPQTIDFTQPASPAVYNTSFTVSPSASSGLTVSVQASGGCTINAGQVTMTSGTTDCTLTASQAGDENYLAADDVVRVVAAAKADQSIDFPQPASPAVYNTSFTVSPSASSNLTVSMQASGGCTINTGQVTMTSGTTDCTLTASQAGDENYLAADDVVRVVAAAKADQSIDFPQPASPAQYNTSFMINPSASSSLMVSVQASGGCTIDAGQVTMTSSTTDCTLTASQVGDGNYNAATDVVRVVSAAKADQSIDFPQPASPAEYNTSFAISPSASSGLTVTVQTSGGCTINAGQVTMTSGTQDCTLTASQAGDENYLTAEDVVRVVTAVKASQAIDFPQPPSSAPEGASFLVNPTADSGLPVGLTVSGSCTAAGYQVTITQPTGTCTLTASQVGDTNYSPAEPVVHTVQALPSVHYLYFPVIH